jgi:hypothetical protein
MMDFNEKELQAMINSFFEFDKTMFRKKYQAVAKQLKNRN